MYPPWAGYPQPSRARVLQRFTMESHGTPGTSQISPPWGLGNFPPTASHSMPVQAQYHQHRCSSNTFKALKAGQQRYQLQIRPWSLEEEQFWSAASFPFVQAICLRCSKAVPPGLLNSAGYEWMICHLNGCIHTVSREVYCSVLQPVQMVSLSPSRLLNGQDVAWQAGLPCHVCQARSLLSVMICNDALCQDSYLEFLHALATPLLELDLLSRLQIPNTLDPQPQTLAIKGEQRSACILWSPLQVIDGPTKRLLLL
eukprot:3667920-Rhodomonas_salina.2